MGWNQYIVNRPTTLTGIHQLELRLLSKMGYELFVVSNAVSIILAKFLSYGCVHSVTH